MSLTATTLYRSFPIETRDVDEAAHEVTAVAATEAPVPTSRGREVLRMSGLDLTRFRGGGICMLDSHDASSIDSVLGSVRKVEARDGNLAVRLRFATEPDCDMDGRALRAFRKVAAGHLRGVSIGYLIHEATRDGDTIIATRWELLEVSLSAVPADRDAGVREVAYQRALRAMTTTNITTRTDTIMSTNETNEHTSGVQMVRARCPKGLEQHAECLLLGGRSPQQVLAELQRMDRVRTGERERVVGMPAEVTDTALRDGFRLAFGDF